MRLDPDFRVDQEFIIVMSLILTAFITAWRMVNCAVVSGL